MLGSSLLVGGVTFVSSSSSLHADKEEAKAKAAAPLAVFLIKLRRLIRCSRMSRKCVLSEVLLSNS